MLDTHLYGRDSELDSLNLVSLIVRIEEEIETEFNQTISLANERAMSLNNSPFRTINSMMEYISSLLMLKILVLQALYNLSDDQTEYQIRDRLSFMRFLGLDLDQRIPDAKTIWLFRETLAHAQVVEILFAQFESYLAEHGYQTPYAIFTNS